MVRLVAARSRQHVRIKRKPRRRIFPGRHRAEGFIKLNALRLRLAKKRER
jgi:hypothetical protein